MFTFKDLKWGNHPNFDGVQGIYECLADDGTEYWFSVVNGNGTYSSKENNTYELGYSINGSLEVIGYLTTHQIETQVNHIIATGEEYYD